MIKEPAFTWGPLARGMYIAMLSLSAPVSFAFPEWILHYVALLTFLGLGFRPLLELTKLYDLFSFLLVSVDNKRWEKRTQEKRREVTLKERDKKYRHRHQKDPKLPPNW